MSTENYVDIINEEWNLIWGSGMVFIYDRDLHRYIRIGYFDLLNNHYLTNRYITEGLI